MVRRSPLEGLLLVYACVTLVTAAVRDRRQTGEAGLDYPTYSEVPPGLSFTCNDKIPGYYADLEAQCQVWHWCVPGGFKYSFLCPNETLFNQVFRVCDWWYNVDCADSPDTYKLNEDLYRVDEVPLARELLQEEGDQTVEETQLVEEEVMTEQQPQLQQEQLREEELEQQQLQQEDLEQKEQQQQQLRQEELQQQQPEETSEI